MFLIQKLSILIFRKEILYLGYYEYGREKKSDVSKYLRVNARDEEWGIVITTVGYQYVSPNHAYPLSKHPDNYNFKNEGKRTSTNINWFTLREEKAIFPAGPVRRHT